MQTSQSKNSILKMIAILIFLSAAASVFVFIMQRFNIPADQLMPFIKNKLPGILKDKITSFGIISPIIFIAIYSLRCLLVIMPVTVFNIAGGLAFGTLWGGVYSLIGAYISAIISFYVSRFLGRDFVVRLLGKRLEKVEGFIGKEGFMVMFYARFIIPYDPLSYAAGLSNISFKTYFLATIIPIIPSIFVWSNVGNSLSHPDLKKFIISVSIVAATISIPIIVKLIEKRTNNRKKKNGE